MKFSSYTVLGIITIVVMLYALYLKLDVYAVERNGTIVEMQITEISSDCYFTKGNYSMKLLYEGTTYSKKIPTSFCKNHRVGEILKMKYLPNNESVLFPNESTQGEFIAIGLIIIAGIISIAIGIHDSRNN